jgi:hypothetical protein
MALLRLLENWRDREDSRPNRPSAAEPSPGDDAAPLLGGQRHHRHRRIGFAARDKRRVAAVRHMGQSRTPRAESAACTAAGQAAPPVEPKS